MDIVDELNAFQDALGRPPEFNDTTDLPMRAAQEITELRAKLAEREVIINMVQSKIGSTDEYPLSDLVKSIRARNEKG